MDDEKRIMIGENGERKQAAMNGKDVNEQEKDGRDGQEYYAKPASMEVDETSA